MHRVKIGYTTGVFDLFHIGHLNLLTRARSACDFLVVGVTTDELALKLKGRKPIIPFHERVEIVKNLKMVDRVVPENDADKLAAWEAIRFDVTFKGDDWKGSSKWEVLEKEFNKRGVEVVFFPYTQQTSSTKLREVLEAVARSNQDITPESLRDVDPRVSA